RLANPFHSPAGPRCVDLQYCQSVPVDLALLGALDSYALRAELVGHGVCYVLGAPILLDSRDHR
ncbi:MAG: hypothetical protein ACKPKO_28140, partial [Candidatus Fonsibacter sp.]